MSIRGPLSDQSIDHAAAVDADATGIPGRDFDSDIGKGSGFRMLRKGRLASGYHGDSEYHRY